MKKLTKRLHFAPQYSTCNKFCQYQKQKSVFHITYCLHLILQFLTWHQRKQFAICGTSIQQNEVLLKSVVVFLILLSNTLKRELRSFHSFLITVLHRIRTNFYFHYYLTQKYSVTNRHTFLERGHTHSEGDSVHNVIQKAARHIPVYTPDQWYTLVRSSEKKLLLLKWPKKIYLTSNCYNNKPQ